MDSDRADKTFFQCLTGTLAVFICLIIETMDLQPSYNDLPWELIASAIQGDLSPEEDLRFREWLSVSGSNREKYERLQQIWKDGMADYALYREANEGKAWEALREKMGDKRVIPMRRWAVAAAVLVLAAGAGWWYISGKGAVTQYATAAGEQKTISLPDGSTVFLNGQTHIQLAGDYNKASRKVVLISGGARFEVSHQEQRPFTVDAGEVSVKDIGTIFAVEKTKDSTNVIVSEGKIAFIEKETGASREIAAGGSGCYYNGEHRFGETRSAGGITGTDPLRFDNAPLSEVITALQKASGKRIVLNDTATAAKRLTVHLDGESFEDALKTICASLNLEYTIDNGAYVLKSKGAATHN